MNCVKSPALCVVTKSTLMHVSVVVSNHTRLLMDAGDGTSYSQQVLHQLPQVPWMQSAHQGSSPQVPTMLCVSCRLYENKGEADFVESLLQLFRSINDMMSSMSELTVRVKVGATMLAQAQAAPSWTERPLVVSVSLVYEQWVLTSPFSR